MLSKTDITKTRDPEKLAHPLSKFTNLIRELVSLAKQYKIEDIFYYGDVLPKIYQQLGDGRMTRFLSTIDDDPSERETQPTQVAHPRTSKRKKGIACQSTRHSTRIQQPEAQLVPQQVNNRQPRSMSIEW